MADLSQFKQEQLQQFVIAYVDEQADQRIQAGANPRLAIMLSTVLGRYLFDDAHTAVTEQNSRDEPTHAAMVQALKAATLDHQLDRIVESFFDPALADIINALLYDEAPQLASERSLQFEKQIMSTFDDVIGHSAGLGEEIDLIVAAFVRLDRLWFQYNFMQAAVGTAEAKSERLRRYIFKALEEGRYINLLVDAMPESKLLRESADRHYERMARLGQPQSVKPPKSKAKAKRKRGFMDL